MTTSSSAQSSLKSYIILKYGYLFFIIPGTIFFYTVFEKGPDGYTVAGETFPLGFGIVFYIFIAICLVLGILCLRFVHRATVTKDEITLGKDSIRWEDIHSVGRFLAPTVYYAKTKNGKWYLFPVQKVPVLLLGESIGDTDMDQIIQLMKRKYDI